MIDSERERNRSNLNLIAVLQPCYAAYRSALYPRPILAAQIIEGYGAKSGLATANGTSVKFADGRNFFLGASDGAAEGPRSK